MTPWFLMYPFFKDWDFNTKEIYHSIRLEKDSNYYAMRI